MICPRSFLDFQDLPVTDEVVLVEDGAVGAEEAVLGEAALAIGGANVEDLALGLGVGIIT